MQEERRFRKQTGISHEILKGLFKKLKDKSKIDSVSASKASSVTVEKIFGQKPSKLSTIQDKLNEEESHLRPFEKLILNMLTQDPDPKQLAYIKKEDYFYSVKHQHVNNTQWQPNEMQVLATYLDLYHKPFMDRHYCNDIIYGFECSSFIASLKPRINFSSKNEIVYFRDDTENCYPFLLIELKRGKYNRAKMDTFLPQVIVSCFVWLSNSVVLYGGSLPVFSILTNGKVFKIVYLYVTQDCEIVVRIDKEYRHIRELPKILHNIFAFIPKLKCQEVPDDDKIKKKFDVIITKDIDNILEVIEEKDAIIEEKDAIIEEKEKEKDAIIEEKDAQILELKKKLKNHGIEV